MTEKSMITDSIEGSVILDLNSQSDFEKMIITAYKSVSVEETYLSLLSAVNYTKLYIEEIKSQPQPITKSLFSRNIIERLKRLSCRQYFHLTIQISKIYIALLDKPNLGYLSSDVAILIQISNEILILLDLIKYTAHHKILLRKSQEFLRFLLDKSLNNLSKDQTDSIQSLLLNLPSKYISESYIKFPDDLKELSIQKANVDTLNKYIKCLSMMNSPDEQYDSLLRDDSLYFINNLLQIDKLSSKAMILANDSDLLFSIGKMLTLFIFNIKYCIMASTESTNTDNEDTSHTYMLIDAHKKNISKIQSSSFANISFSFLNQSIYEISDDQKELMYNNEKTLVYLINIFIYKVLNSFPDKYDLQYVCFVLLKRMCFIFNDSLENIGESLIKIIDNLLKLSTGKDYSKEMVEVVELLLFLSNRSTSTHVADLLKERMSKIKQSGVYESVGESINIDQIDTENIDIKSWNLLVGYPITYVIEPGAMHNQYFEITKDNSLIYIYFTIDTKDITFHLLKYSHNPGSSLEEGDKKNFVFEDQTDKGHFIRVFQLERVECSNFPIKIIIFVQSPGIYKMIFDNSYSWITSKEIKCRINVLKPLTPILNFEKGDSEIEAQSIDKKFFIYYKMINHCFDISLVEKRIQQCKNEQDQIILPIIAFKNSISIYYQAKSYAFIDPQNLGILSQKFLEESLESFLSENNIITNPAYGSIVLSFFSLNSIDSQGNTIEDNEIKDDMIPDEDNGLSVETLGAYLKDFRAKYPNVEYHYNILVDIALICSIYNLEKSNKDYESICYFHIDSQNTQVCVYNDGMIYEEISGFDYKSDIPLIGNLDLFIEVIKKTNESFENVQVEVSYSNISDELSNEFSIKFKEAIKKQFKNPSIPLIKHGKNDIDFILNYSHIFLTKYTN